MYWIQLTRNGGLGTGAGWWGVGRRNGRRKWHSGRWVTWAAARELKVEFANWQEVDKGEGLRSKLTSGLWIISSPKRTEFHAASLWERGQAQDCRELPIAHCVLWDLDWFISCFYSTCQVLRTGRGTLNILNKCLLLLLPSSSSSPLSFPFLLPHPISGPWYHLTRLC